MIIKRIDVFIYGEKGWGYQTEHILNPKWGEIEAAIRRLDRHCYPFVWLHADANAAEDEIPFMTIMGGAGAYLIEGYPEGRHVVYYDETNGNEEIEVWTSDQGHSASAKKVCKDIEVVLRATKYLCENGNFDPQINWRS